MAHGCRGFTLGYDAPRYGWGKCFHYRYERGREQPEASEGAQQDWVMRGEDSGRRAREEEKREGQERGQREGGDPRGTKIT